MSAMKRFYTLHEEFISNLRRELGKRPDHPSSSFRVGHKAFNDRLLTLTDEYEKSVRDLHNREDSV